MADRQTLSLLSALAILTGCAHVANGEDDPIAAAMAQNAPAATEVKSSLYLSGFEPKEGEDCYGVDCLNGGWCIDGEPGDGQYTCLCTSGFQAGDGPQYADRPAVCEANSTKLGFAIQLNEPSYVLPSSADSAALSGFEGFLVFVIVLLVIVLAYLLYTMPEKKAEHSVAEKERRAELASLRERGLGDVAQKQSEFEAFEFTNNPLRKPAEVRGSLDLTGGMGGDNASGYLDIHDGESMPSHQGGLPAGMTDSEVWMEI